MTQNAIRVRGARQNNLKGLDIDLPLGELIVITGVSGSGKSSLAFDTVYAEGQRRYVETFSAYARQFLDRMDKPAVDYIDGIPPAIAIDQTNPVRTSRSTVGTMTELNDHIKLFYARAGELFCERCARVVCQDTPTSIATELLNLTQDAPGDESTRLVITFPINIPESFTVEEVKGYLVREGYTRVQEETDQAMEIVQDRLRLHSESRDRLVDSLDAALQRGQGQVTIYRQDTAGTSLEIRRYSTALHCPDCNLSYRIPTPGTFSFNSPLGACDTCRGFGRIMGIDPNLVIPDHNKSLAAGAIKPWQTKSYAQCQEDLLRHAKSRGIDTHVPWLELEAGTKHWVFCGEGKRSSKRWYGVEGFFKRLESKSYRMPIRVLLSKYRAYHLCPDCLGARLKPEALNYRLGDIRDATTGLGDQSHRFRAKHWGYDESTLAHLPGLGIHDLMSLSIERVAHFFATLHLPKRLDEATTLLLGEIRSRLKFLTDVGLGYLTLDRQSRTLSGGEVQRINLTTALGTSLVNTLFVLDEPSIGLHPRDITRLVGVLHRLRDIGNTLLVVEHDRQIMLSADRVIDLGPGPGHRGGNIVFQGTPKQLSQAAPKHGSLTGEYLTGQRRIAPRVRIPLPPAEETSWLVITEARANNLQCIEARFPLQRFVCLSGVSGSGKSTLVENILYRGALRHLGKPSESPGAHGLLLGLEEIDDVILVDQSAIGKTTRSNPASYVGALSPIRKLFAELPGARERGYDAGAFSFNSGEGRCPLCKGSGFEHIEMQFLSDVYLRCPDCDGRRFRDDVLELKLLPLTKNPALTEETGRSIADILDMTVQEALDFFSSSKEIQRALEPLQSVGLNYISLGQPVSSLSGGEAQRLKLAGHLTKAASTKSTSQHLLFLFDEPTTGLHFDDIHRLINAFSRLLTAGHSLIVIEHNLDIIRTADWVIDLGPDGGENGGKILFSGSPDDLRHCAQSATAQALCEDAKGEQSELNPLQPLFASPVTKKSNDIAIYQAREHNLKGIDLRIPRQGLTVITGVSGSGKSTIAFDILFAEGQRRYLESLNAYARQFVQPAARPDVDAVLGLPPTVAIEQRTSRGGKKSTAATVTGIYHFLRLLFTKLGEQYCPDCEIRIAPQSTESILAHALKRYRNKTVTVLSPLVTARKGYYTDLAKWAVGRGFTHLRVDGELFPTEPWPRLDRFREHTIELPIGTLTVNATAESALRNLLNNALGLGGGVVELLLTPSLPSSSSPSLSEIFSTQRACPSCQKSFPEPDPRLLSFNSKHGWCPTCYGLGEYLPGFDGVQTGEEPVWLDESSQGTVCPTCHGERLRTEARAIRFRGMSIAQFTHLTVSEAEGRLNRWTLKERETAIAEGIITELLARLRFLREVGLDYLCLDRSAPTLSGGEAQRIRLAAQLGSNLRGVCYVLDEPTIGLHARDNQRLLNILEQLETQGNTVVVVEHDEETIRRAHHVVDLGPGAGTKGGEVIASGPLSCIVANKRSITGQYLTNPLKHPLLKHSAPTAQSPHLQIHGVNLHNLKNIDAQFPLGCLICVTGVSGSGKSSLVRGVLQPNLTALVAKRKGRVRDREKSQAFIGCVEFTGYEKIDRVLEVNQTPIGKTPRSCPATYLGIWDYIRGLYAASAEARIRGYRPGQFSFNVVGGRCEACQGQGQQRIEMHFLPDVRIPCDECGGSRFNWDTRQVLYRGQSIADILAMNAAEATEFFAAHSTVRHVLQLMCDIGLDYLTLGQPSPTLSGGEVQRLKLVTELAKASLAPREEAPQSDRQGARLSVPHHTLYVLDEPTIGLHMADVGKLILVLHRLVKAGNTVVVIEHNLDLVAEANWLIDMGPEGGAKGGRVLAQGPLSRLRRSKRSHTAHALNAFLETRGQLE